MTNRESLYKLIRIAIGNDNDLTLPTDFNLFEAMALSEDTGVNCLAVSGFQKLVDSGIIASPAFEKDDQRLMIWMGLSIMMEQKTRLQWDAIQKLVGILSAKGITTVGLKGVTVGQWYPNPMLRDSCDFDCFLLKNGENGVNGFAYEEGNQVVEARGIAVDRRIYVHSVFEYKGMTVENHHYLAAIKLSKRHRKMDKLFRTLLLEEPLKPVMDSQLMMGSPMFNAIFLTHHAHRHMLNEYMPIKLLTDWALFIKNNAALDWERFWRYVDEFGMLRFAQSMTRLTCKLLGTNVPFELPADEEADSLLEESLWDLPEEPRVRKSLFARRLGIISNIMHASKRYKVFYDYNSIQMIVAYVKGYLFGKE
jgi:hypothetical protein